ncbi:MAG: hypothetical protein VW475_12760 [Curvibacter sp.]
MNEPHHYLPLLRSGRWFAQLPPDFAQALLRLAKVRQLASGEVLFLRGQDDQALRQMEFALKEADGQFALRSKLGARRDEMERLSKEEF